MTLSLQTIEAGDDLAGFNATHGRRCPRGRARACAHGSGRKKPRVAHDGRGGARCRAKILAANAEDVAEAAGAGASPAFVDRLKLDDKRVLAIAAAVEAIAELPDPVGTIIAAWERPNGLRIERVRVPLGVVGVIFESRPNVTADAGALCLKAGNAVILRGGSDSFRSSQAIHAAMQTGLAQGGLPQARSNSFRRGIATRSAMMLAGLDGTIDVIVPRGGKNLVARVQSEARVPVFAHLDGNCHVYVDHAADPGMAEAIVINAKMRRTGICGAAETLLVDRRSNQLVPLVKALIAAGCEVRGDRDTQAVILV